MRINMYKYHLMNRWMSQCHCCECPPNESQVISGYRNKTRSQKLQPKWWRLWVSVNSVSRNNRSWMPSCGEVQQWWQDSHRGTCRSSLWTGAQAFKIWPQAVLPCFLASHAISVEFSLFQMFIRDSLHHIYHGVIIHVLREILRLFYGNNAQ